MRDNSLLRVRTYVRTHPFASSLCFSRAIPLPSPDIFYRLSVHFPSLRPTFYIAFPCNSRPFDRNFHIAFPCDSRPFDRNFMFCLFSFIGTGRTATSTCPPGQWVRRVTVSAPSTPTMVRVQGMSCTHAAGQRHACTLCHPSFTKLTLETCCKHCCFVSRTPCLYNGRSISGAFGGLQFRFRCVYGYFSSRCRRFGVTLPSCTILRIGFAFFIIPSANRIERSVGMNASEGPLDGRTSCVEPNGNMNQGSSNGGFVIF